MRSGPGQPMVDLSWSADGLLGLADLCDACPLDLACQKKAWEVDDGGVCGGLRICH